MSALSVAVIGLGLGRHFVAACDENLAVARVALCDPDEDARRQVRAAHPKVHADYDRMEAMLEAESPDVVCIVTPDHLHRPQAEACLKAGAHVLVSGSAIFHSPDYAKTIQQMRSAWQTVTV